MNEASSKYVDQIAMQRLINDKLSLVHHAPDRSGTRIDASFDDFDEVCERTAKVAESVKKSYVDISFSSAITTQHDPNNMVRSWLFRADTPLGDVVFVHGLYEDNTDIYRFFFELLNEQGINVYLMMLPFHYERTPKESSFSGEFFWSADVNRSALAFKQAVYDLCQLYRHVKQVSRRSVWVVGFSMGAGIGLSLASLMAMDGVFAINPVCNIADLMWNSTLFATIKHDLESNSIDLDEIKDSYRRYDPLNVERLRVPLERVVVAKGLYDQINDPRNYELLYETWRLRHFLSYKAGHLNILRVPKLAADVVEFCTGRA